MSALESIRRNAARLEVLLLVAAAAVGIVRSRFASIRAVRGMLCGYVLASENEDSTLFASLISTFLDASGAMSAAALLAGDGTWDAADRALLLIDAALFAADVAVAAAIVHARGGGAAGAPLGAKGA